MFTYIDHDGRRRVKSTGCTTKRDARDFIREFMDRFESGTSVTFAEYAAPFFVPGQCPREARLRAERKNYGRTHMEKSRDWLERFVLKDRFALIPMNEIRRRDVIDLRSRLMQQMPEKQNTVGKTLAVVKTILSEAVFREDIQTNPGASVTPPSYDREETGVFTLEEIRTLLRKMPDLVATDKAKSPDRGRRPRMVAFMTSLFCAGLRMSEARAWRWEDIDLEANTFQVVRAVKDRQGSIADPKWDKRREGLQLPSVLKSALVAWRSELEEQFTGYVFPDLNGEPVSETVVRRAWRRMLSNGKVDAGERWLKPHSARHSLNTHLLAARVPALDVQLYLGWQSQEAKVLTRVQENYTHMQLLSTVSVADAVDRLYGPAPASSEQQQQK